MAGFAVVSQLWQPRFWCLARLGLAPRAASQSQPLWNNTSSKDKDVPSRTYPSSCMTLHPHRGRLGASIDELEPAAHE
jgi:hypothetical protein